MGRGAEGVPTIQEHCRHDGRKDAEETDARPRKLAYQLTGSGFQRRTVQEKVEQMADKVGHGDHARGEGTWKQHLEKLGRRVEAVHKYIEKEWDDGRRIKVVRFKIRYATDGDVLVVLTADKDGAGEVAFMSAPDFEDAVSTLGGHLLNGKLRWKPDEYAT